PLSMPPGLAMRPTPPVSIPSSRGGGPVSDQSAGSAGQDALVEAAGPPSEAHIRTGINESSGLVYPDPGFVHRLIGWGPPTGYHRVFSQAGRSGAWSSRIF